MGASIESGERTFNQQCKSCHTVEKGGPSPLGPNLFGVIGRKAGSAAGFASSDGMKNSGITWDEASLADYLKDPKAKVPGDQDGIRGPQASRRSSPM